MLESYRKNAGTPCGRCASMKLTENKFIISEYSKHHRTNRPVARSPPASVSVDTLGLDGLGFGPREFKLGTLEELFGRREDCPFCGLAVTSLSEQCKSSIQDPDIEVETEAEFYKANVTCFVSTYKLSFEHLSYSKDSFRFTKLSKPQRSSFSHTIYRDIKY
jgi:hypothetical protein